MRLRVVHAALAAVCCVATATAWAQKYPERPIRLILGVAPGGGQDTVSRAMAPKLTNILGVSIVVDNRPGGSGTIGVELAKDAAPDGYTALMASASNVINPLLYGGSYDLPRDFLAVGQLVTQPYLLAVPMSLPVTSVRDLIAYAKSSPGRLAFASAGNGTVTHLAAELFREQAQVEITHIPYKGTGAAYPDLFAGRVQASFLTIVSALGHVKAGRLRALAVSSLKPVASAPGVPTVAESGLPGFSVTQWYGVLVPLRTSAAIVSRLNSAFVEVVKDPEMAKHFAGDGAEAAPSTPGEFATHIRAEQDRWANVVKRAGLSVKK